MCMVATKCKLRQSLKLVKTCFTHDRLLNISIYLFFFCFCLFALFHLNVCINLYMWFLFFAYSKHSDQKFMWFFIFKFYISLVILFCFVCFWSKYIFISFRIDVYREYSECNRLEYKTWLFFIRIAIAKSFR